MFKILAFFCLSFLFTFISPAQTKYVLSIVPTQRGVSGEELKLRIEFTNVAEIVEAKLFYRVSGESRFNQIEIPLSRENIIVVTIPGKNVKAPLLEVFLEIMDKNREVSYFPGRSSEEFMQIPVSATEESEAIIILSPDKGASVRLEDLIISASLIDVENFDPEKTQILFNNVDVTSLSVISPELVTFIPDNVNFQVRPGVHKATIILRDKADKVVARTSWEFKIISPVEAERRERAINYGANLEIEVRQESVKNRGYFYVRGRGNFNSSYRFLNFNTNLYLTTEERNNIQPQHRFLIEGNLSDWVRLGFGDVYPNFSTLVLSGYRVRGFYGKLDLRYFQVEIVSGETVRKVEGSLLREIPIDSLRGTLPQNSIYDSTNRKVRIYNYGTYSRNLFAVKPALKFGRNFEFGFSYLVSEDDKTSIKFGGNPQRNIVFGSNLLLSFDNQRAEIRAQGALSIRNENLKAKSWTNQDIDSLFKDTPDLRDNLKKYRPLIEKFVPINQYVVPINPLGLSSLAYEVGLNLNYFGNLFKFDYIFHGNEYLSFGQPYLRQDIQGFRIFDRLRLLNNQVFLTLRFENLRDNTRNQRDYTTKFVTWEVSAMYSPLMNFPNLALTYSQSTSDNGLSFNDTLRAMNVKINKLSFDVSYNFEYIFRNRVNFAFSISGSDDKTILNSDFSNINFALSLYSDIRENLRGNFIFAFNNSKFKKAVFGSGNRFIGNRDERFNYVSFGGGADYRIGKARVWGNLAPSLGDLKRLYIYFGGSYEFAQNQSLNLNCNLLFYNYVDVVAYLTYKISF
ncbi:MAG: hypothetical protein ABDI07_06085 [Candidatus Kryptonium sp.]